MTAPAAHFAMLHLDNIQESKTNPRKSFGDLDELAASVQEKGVLSPVKVRPVNGHFELVFGERRWRAAKKVGLKEIPALVQEMTDKEVLEEQLVENSQRTDVPPLEEAEGYRTLIEKHGYSPDDLAAKVGKSKRVIYERIQLCKLGKEGRKALDEERLNASVALLIARIPGEMQAEAVKAVAARDEDDSALSYRAAAEHIHNNFMLQLKDAPFSLTDAQLVAKAGACSACPKRTGNQPELFADVKAKDVCTDPRCYRAKEDAVWALKVREAENAGQKVLSAAETKKVFPNDYSDAPAYGTPFVALDHEEYVGGKMKSVKSLLGKDAPTPVLARTPSGKIVELTSKELVAKKVRELEPTRRGDGSNSNETAQRKAYEVRKAVVASVAVQLVEAAKKKHEQVLLDIVRERIRFAEPKTIALIAPAFSIAGAKDDEAREKALAAAVCGPDLPAVLLALNVLPNAAGGTYSRSYHSDFDEACKTLKIDLKKAEVAIKEEKKVAKPKKSAPATAACSIPGCGEPGKRVKGSPGLWCKSHGEKLSAAERKSIAERNKWLAAPAKKKGGKR
jgi:ParB/RepB/Spo0J family partition protein